MTAIADLQRRDTGLSGAAAEEIFTRDDLGPAEKIVLLHDLQQDLREQMVAVEENMPGRPEDDDSLGVALAQVVAYLDELGAARRAEPVPTKHG